MGNFTGFNRARSGIAARSGSDGFTILETLIAAGMMGIVSLLFAEMLSNQGKSVKGMQAIESVRDLLSEMRSTLADEDNCTKSFGGLNPSAMNAPVPIWRKDPTSPPRPGTPIWPASPQFVKDQQYGTNLKITQISFNNFRQDSSSALNGLADMTLSVGPVGNFAWTGSPNLVRVLKIQVTLATPGGAVKACVALSSALSDSLWQLDPATVGNTGNEHLYYNGGLVGIGTSNPSAQLHVLQSSTSSSATMFLQNTAGGSNANATQYLSSANGDSFSVYQTPATNWTVGVDHLDGDKLKISNPPSNPVPGAQDRLTITPPGNVGIGTNNPSALLEVNGTIRAPMLQASSATNALQIKSQATVAGVGSVYFYDGASVPMFETAPIGSTLNNASWLRADAGTLTRPAHLGGVTPVGYPNPPGVSIGPGVAESLIVDGNGDTSIMGFLRYPAGAGANRVLVSDAGGNARWQDVVAHANYADTAGYASSAGTATNASNAGNAWYANNAGYATESWITTWTRSYNTGNMIYFGYNAGMWGMFVDNTWVKQFVIAHPTDPERLLVHGTLEGPEGAVFYRGDAQLVDGKAEVALPGYFEALTHLENRTVQLTAIDGFDPIAVRTFDGAPVKDGRFRVYSSVAHSHQRFHWEVKAERADVSRFEVEPLRSEVEVEGFGPYRVAKPKARK